MAAVRRILGLDLGAYSIKALELTAAKGQIGITGFGCVDIPEESNISSAIRTLITTNNLSTRHVVTAVSGRSVIVRDIPMPEMSQDELRTALQFEADKYIPFEVADVTMDCQKLEQPPTTISSGPKEIKVRLIAVKRSVVEDHLRFLTDAGIKPFIVDYDSFALGNALEMQQLVKGSQLPDEPVALIDIGRVKTSINIVRGRQSLFTREVYVAGQDFSNAIGQRLSLDAAEVESAKRNPGERLQEIHEAVSTTVDDLGNEVALSFDYFENQFDQKVTSVYLCGGGSELEGITESFADVFRRETFKWDPTEGVPIASSRLDETELSQLGSRLSIALGLAARIYEG